METHAGVEQMKWLVLLLFGGIGLALLVGGSAWTWERYALSARAERAEGQVVSIHESESIADDIDERRGLRRRIVSYIPVVEFTTVANRVVRFRSGTGSNTPDYEVGATVDVLYDPARPDAAEIADFAQFWLGPIAVTGAGLFALIIGIGGFFLIGAGDAQSKAALEHLRQKRLQMR
jgi:hypothetical protein